MSDIFNKILKKREEKTEQNQITDIQECSKQQSVSKITLLTTSEGKIFLAGIVFALLYTVWLGAAFIFDPVNVQNLVGVTGLEILFGRAASMAYGYSFGIKHSTIILVCMVIETILVLLFYPLFVFSWRHLLVIKSLKRFFDKLQKAAVTHQDKVRKYGLIGLFAFVWFPFWMTGPVVGCVIGFMMALPVWLNLSVVLIATYIAIFCWAFFLHTVHQQVADYSPFAAMILMLIIIIIVIMGIFLSKVRQVTKKRNSNNK
ncbi:MAG: small multi-drug export protein [Sedimentisphaerales bacterium]|nr:small multi-drug export protein [Sedimentisphaerales bacterium]